MTDPGSRPPLVSIAMPVYNVERTILDAVESIRYQTLTDWELLVIDDGSTDRTREMLGRVRDPRVRVITHDRNAGVGQRLNEAIAVARGEYLARLDGDDVAYPDRLEIQLAYLREHPEVDLVGCWLVLLDGNRRAFGTWRPPEDHAAITVRPYHSILLAHPAFFGRRAWALKHPYRPEFLHTEDQMLLMESAPHSTFANVQQVLVAYRQPSSAMRAVLRRRVATFRNATRFFIRHKQYVNIVRNLVSHSSVAAVELLANVTRLRHRLLIHRVSRLSEAQEAEWREVWAKISAAVRAYDEPGGEERET